ncbi:MAG: hypothetical protein JRJ12_15565 [Deltaproteobacteria bacterium]|nr:hypothetical protein [Deltaproteobacteria bacterium]
MRVLAFRRYQKNTLQGFFELALESGLVVRDMCYHSSTDGKRWIAFPARPYQNEGGEVKYANIVYVPDQERWQVFKKQALAALDEYFSSNQHEDPQDIPF